MGFVTQGIEKQDVEAGEFRHGRFRHLVVIGQIGRFTEPKAVNLFAAVHHRYRFEAEAEDIERPGKKAGRIVSARSSARSAELVLHSRDVTCCHESPDDLPVPGIRRVDEVTECPSAIEPRAHDGLAMDVDDLRWEPEEPEAGLATSLISDENDSVLSGACGLAVRS